MMNHRLVIRLIGKCLEFECLFMVLALLVSLYYQDGDTAALALSAMLTGAVGLGLSLVKPEDDRFHKREGFITVSLVWAFMSLLGALPFYFSGHFNSFMDCLFESVSGFTTTGASILNNVEVMPRGVLFWRNLTHWLGGMGVLVLALAIVPTLRPSAITLMRAEAPGPTPGKLVPRIRDTAVILYTVYLVLTAALVILLVLSGLPFYDSLLHAFGTAGTGGFSIKNNSIGAYGNQTAEMIIGLFVFLFGINFSLYYFLFKRDFKSFFADEEFLWYVGIFGLSVFLIFMNLERFGLYDTVGETFRHAFFQVASMSSTTGYASTDLTLWPTTSKAILFLLMLIGCCGGSTGGGIKVLRLIAILKAIRLELNKILHPRVVKSVTVNGKKTDDSSLSKIYIYFFIYLGIMVLAILVISLDNRDIVSTVTVVLSAISNVGIDLHLFGAAGTWASFSPVSKLTLSFCMLAGRLEFFPLLVLFVPSAWKR